MAILTGGQALTSASGRTLASVQLSDLGQVRRANADMDHFGMIGGKGDARVLRRHITALQTYYTQEQRRRRTSGAGCWRGLGVCWAARRCLYVGGMTEPEIEARKELAERTGSALRSAMGCGFVPGGGVALLACQAALQGPFDENAPLEKRAAFRILARALEEPLRTILTNAGMELEEWIGPIRQAGAGDGRGHSHPENDRDGRGRHSGFCGSGESGPAERRLNRGHGPDGGCAGPPAQSTPKRHTLKAQPHG